MQRADFHFDLPAELIAQRPAETRSGGRMLVLDGATGTHRDIRFRDFPSLLAPEDLLVFNDTRVVPARVFGVKESGGRVEMLLERVLAADTALVHLKASKGLRTDAVVRLPGGHTARMRARERDLFRLQFSCEVLAFFQAHGAMPLPPYIDRPPESADRERYQTVFARSLGAVAAPTAGLHFDAEIFSALRARGVRHAFVTLHVGAGTFQPVRVDDIDAHEMHEEYLEVPEATCAAMDAARAAGGRVVAVGTTVVRSLETAAAASHPAGGSAGTDRSGEGDRGAAADGGVAAGVGAAGDGAAHRGGEADRGGAAPNRLRVKPYRGVTRIFIKPGFRFRAVDAMVTNFHLPESTLLMLCSAFVGREALLEAYAHAVQAQYRFFSYGDAMFLTPSAAARDLS